MAFDGPPERGKFQSTHPARGATVLFGSFSHLYPISIHAPREGCDPGGGIMTPLFKEFQSTHPARGATERAQLNLRAKRFQSTHPARGATLASRLDSAGCVISIHAPREGCDSISLLGPILGCHFNPRTPRGVRQQTLPKSREFAWLNLLICTRGRRLSIRKQTRLCSMKLSFMLFGCEPAGEGVSSWTSHATKSKVRLEGRSAYSQSVRSSAHSDFPGNKSGGCPVRDP